MGMDVRIGPFQEDEELNEYHRIPHLQHQDAPHAAGSWMMPRINSFGTNLRGWHDFFERHPEVKNLSALDDEGDWAWGVYEITKADLVVVELELARLRAKHPGLVPAFRTESVEARDLAVLEWFAWWIEFSIREFGEDMAAIEVTY